MAKLIVLCALLLIGKNFISFIQLFELRFTLLVTRMEIRVILFRHLSEGAFDIAVRGTFFYAQDFIIISFCQCPNTLLPVKLLGRSQSVLLWLPKGFIFF